MPRASSKLKEEYEVDADSGGGADPRCWCDMATKASKSADCVEGIEAPVESPSLVGILG